MPPLPLLLAPLEPCEPSLAAIRASLFAEETHLIAQLLPLARLEAHAEKAVYVRTLSLAQAVRQQATHDPFDAFLQRWGLDSAEGVALMALAEALLRIPDTPTQDALIRDLLDERDWQRTEPAHGWVNAASRGLLLAETWIDHSRGPHWLDRLVRRLGEPVLRTALKAGMQRMAEHFVLGETLPEALRQADPRWRYSYDMLGEAALTHEDAAEYFAAYHSAIATLAARRDTCSGLARQSVSVKLSALYPRYEPAQTRRVMAVLYPRLQALAQAAAAANLVLSVDAEEAERLELSLHLFSRLAREPQLQDWDGLGLVVQAYQKRAPAVIDWLVALAQDTGLAYPVRLVKGAYWDSEVKRAQQGGWPDYPVYTRKAHTDVAYLACARKLLAARGAVQPQFASHNAQTLSWIIEATAHETPRPGSGHGFEIQRLHGMGEALHARIVEQTGIPSRVYAPVGRFAALLPYLVRRLMENGANASFVHRLADPKVALETIAESPVERLQRSPLRPGLPAPGQIDPPRQPAAPFCVFDPSALEALQAELHPWAEHAFTAAPQVNGEPWPGTPQPCTPPADPARVIGSVVPASPQAVQAALHTAATYAPAWQACPVAERAARLDATADALERRRPALLYLLMTEAGKTLPDALGEVREAIDLCRYYAAQARRLFGTPQVLPGVTGESNQLSWAGRGPFLCLAPWNFPLAIFIGQIAAALVAGNTVIAKPSRRTPLIGQQAIDCLREAGLPGPALSYLPGPSGESFTALLADPRLAGVALTGANATARSLQQALAAREGPLACLIAETGGLNVMLADSSAHVEQLIQDVLSSAFNSAGQRCSALRILLLQEDMADTVMARLGQAMQTLHVGDPLHIETDIGPLIDTQAAQAVRDYTTTLAAQARCIARTPLPPGLDNPASLNQSSYIAPQAYEVTLDTLPREEVFGPVLHVARFPTGGVEEALQRVNALGYGLTLGLHTRLGRVIDTVRQQARVGNLYVNRNQIGAMVGAQPFGGEGLSGTGFKAGGPHYLLRFATERTLTINTAAVGGNLGLLVQDEFAGKENEP